MLRTVKHRLRNWREARRKQDLFLRLDDHLLKDIGLIGGKAEKPNQHRPQF